jgi:hypothetical protein
MFIRSLCFNSKFSSFPLRSANYLLLDYRMLLLMSANIKLLACLPAMLEKGGSSGCFESLRSIT